MAKQIIILERVDAAGDIGFRYALWAAVPAARQAFYANPAAASEWTGASAAEVQALQLGQVVERVDVYRSVQGTTIGTIQAALQAAFTVFQNAINGTNQWSRYGTFFDGTSWTAGGN